MKKKIDFANIKRCALYDIVAKNNGVITKEMALSEKFCYTLDVMKASRFKELVAAADYVDRFFDAKDLELRLASGEEKITALYAGTTLDIECGKSKKYADFNLVANRKDGVEAFIALICANDKIEVNEAKIFVSDSGVIVALGDQSDVIFTSFSIYKDEIVNYRRNHIPRSEYKCESKPLTW